MCRDEELLVVSSSWELCELILKLNTSKMYIYLFHTLITLGPAYNEFRYKENPLRTSRFPCIKIIDYNVKKFSYCEHLPTGSSFLCIHLLILSETRCSLLQYHDHCNITNITIYIFLYNVCYYTRSINVIVSLVDV